MGLQVLSLSCDQAVVSVPLAPNINHVSTAFGGSLYAAAALACYALFQAISREAGGLSDNLVIQEGKIRYLAPVLGDFEIHATPEGPEDVRSFIAALKRHGRARMKLKSQVLCQGKPCAEFEGVYVFRHSS